MKKSILFIVTLVAMLSSCDKKDRESLQAQNDSLRIELETSQGSAQMLQEIGVLIDSIDETRQLLRVDVVDGTSYLDYKSRLEKINEYMVEDQRKIAEMEKIMKASKSNVNWEAVLGTVNGIEVNDKAMLKSIFEEVTRITSRPVDAPKGILEVKGCPDYPKTRESLTNIRTVTKIYDGNQNLGLSALGFEGLKLGKTDKNYNVFYVETKAVECNGVKKTVGIGYSIHLLVKKLSKSISLSNLASISASVQLDSRRTEVYYSMKSFGLTGYPLVKYFKPVVNRPFDVDGHGIMQANIEGIHNILSDSVVSKHIKFTPEELNFGDGQ